MEEDTAAAQPQQETPQDTTNLGGCKHYRRRCKIRAPCCNQIFSCRHCHNEATSLLTNPQDVHEIVRHDVRQVICSLCNTEQPVAQVCSNCGVKMGEYFCDVCKFYDDETDKGHFHCDGCGICRNDMIEKNLYRCPICFKSLGDMSVQWRFIDEEIAATPMPEKYNYEVAILCCDCHATCETAFHIFGLKCGACGSYNTRRTETSSDQ